MNNVVETISIRRYKAGYEVWEERITYHHEDETPDHMLIVKSAYSPTGDYIGSPHLAHQLCKKHGIKPEKADPDHCVCSIGFSASSQKWYGWDPKAIHGFAVGDVVKEGDRASSSGWTDEYLEKHPEEDLSLPVGFTASTLEDAKRMAAAFASNLRLPKSCYILRW